MVDTPATELSALSDFIGLEVLLLNGTQAPDLVDAAAMPALRYLNLDRSPVSDLGPLAFHPALRSLDANETDVADLAPLASIPHLESVSVLGNTLDAESLNIHIPALLAAGVCVAWEDPPCRTPPVRQSKMKQSIGAPVWPMPGVSQRDARILYSLPAGAHGKVTLTHYLDGSVAGGMIFATLS